MTTSSTPTTPAASAESPTSEQTARWILGCPDWCTLPTLDHVPEFDDQGVLRVWHYTSFGLISISADTHNGVLGEVEADIDGVTLTIDELRRAAADALAAAQWLEGQRAG